MKIERGKPGASAPNRSPKSIRIFATRGNILKILVTAVFLVFGLFQFNNWSDAQSQDGRDRQLNSIDRQISQNADNMVEQGRQIFRHDTFGDEAFWTDVLKINQAIAGSKLGGVGPGVSPATALAVGLKVDVEALP